MNKQWIIFILILIFTTLQVQATTVGPNNPTSSGTDNSIGTIDWNNVNNTYSSNDSRTTTNSMANGDQSYYVTLTGFGFTIPAGSTIAGITIDVERRDAAGAGNVKDNVVRIIKGGTITGTDKAVATNWPSVDAIKTYGSNTDLWGTTWTAADINASNFGVAISVKKSGGGTNSSEIDHVRITVDYTAALPVELLYFNTTAQNNYNLVEWATASEINSSYFLVEKSDDFKAWQQLARLEAAGFSSSKIEYTLIDSEPSLLTYYRLSQADYDGQTKIYDVRCVLNSKTDNSAIKITLNQGIDFTDIRLANLPEESLTINLLDLSGEIIYREQLLTKKDQTYNLQLYGTFEKLYFLVVASSNQFFVYKFVSN